MTEKLVCNEDGTSEYKNLKHYKVIYKVIMDNCESEEQALSGAVKSIREKALRQDGSEDDLWSYLKLVEISDEDANDGRI